MDFEWDIEKELDNVKKHGVSFLEAIETFSDPDGFAMEDIKHSGNEARYYWIGKSRRGRILTTRYTRRGNNIRLIGSAEWREFRKLYYEKTSTE
jgi:uncharacterized DUF497 family protein